MFLASTAIVIGYAVVQTQGRKKGTTMKQTLAATLIALSIAAPAVAQPSAQVFRFDSSSDPASREAPERGKDAAMAAAERQAGMVKGQRASAADMSPGAREIYDKMMKRLSKKRTAKDESDNDLPSPNQVAARAKAKDAEDQANGSRNHDTKFSTHSDAGDFDVVMSRLKEVELAVARAPSTSLIQQLSDQVEGLKAVIREIRSAPPSDESQGFSLASALILNPSEFSDILLASRDVGAVYDAVARTDRRMGSRITSEVANLSGRLDRMRDNTLDEQGAISQRVSDIKHHAGNSQRNYLDAMDELQRRHVAEMSSLQDEMADYRSQTRLHLAALKTQNALLARRLSGQVDSKSIAAVDKVIESQAKPARVQHKPDLETDSKTLSMRYDDDIAQQFARLSLLSVSDLGGLDVLSLSQADLLAQD